MWSPFALRPPKSVAPAATSWGHQSARFGGTCTPTSGMSRRASAMSRCICSIETGVAHFGSPISPARPVADAGGPAPAGRGVGDVGGLAAVVAGVRDEVLQDDLLQVAVLGVHRGERLERRDALVLGLADPDEDPAREGNPQLAGRADRGQAPLGVLRRRPLVSDEAGVDGLEHEPLRGGHLAQPGEVGGSSTPRFVCGSSPRSSARSQAQTT